MKVILFLAICTIAVFARAPLDPENKILTPRTWDDYYVELYEHPIIIVGFHDSKESAETSENVLTVLTYLRNSEFVDSREIPVMSVDMSLAPKVRKFYDFEDSPHLWIFVRNRAYKFEDFRTRVNAQDRDQSIASAYYWMSSVIEGLIEEVIDPIKFEQDLANHGVITVYFGDRNEKYSQFRDFILQYSKDPLFAVFDSDLRKEILERYDTQQVHQVVPGDDFMAIIWHSTKLSELDSVPFQAMSDFDDKKSMELFYQFETQPKVRSDASTSDNVFAMYQRQLPLFLYNYKDDSGAETRLKELKNALKVLPKRFIFDIFEHGSRRAIDYQHIMIQSSGYTLVEPNKIYIMWLSHGTQPSIMEFKDVFTSQKIVEWTFEFARMFPFLFGNSLQPSPKAADPAGEEL